MTFSYIVSTQQTRKVVLERYCPTMQKYFEVKRQICLTTKLLILNPNTLKHDFIGSTLKNLNLQKIFMINEVIFYFIQVHFSSSKRSVEINMHVFGKLK